MNQYSAIESVIAKLDKSISEPLKIIAKKTKAPKIMILTQMLSTSSIAIQKLVDISPKHGMKIPVSLYVMILAASGERKSSVDKILMNAVREFEKTLIEKEKGLQEKYRIDHDLWSMKLKNINKQLNEMFNNGEESAELLELWNAHNLKKPILHVERRLLIEDVTGAKLKSMLGGDGTSLALVSDEAGTLISSDLIKDNSLFCSLWSGQSILIDRMNSSRVSIENARLTISMQIQPNVYRKFMATNGEAMRSSGFNARFLFCEPESEIGYRFEGVDDKTSFHDEITLSQFNSRIDSLLKAGMANDSETKDRHCLSLTDMALDVWLKKFNEIEFQMRDGEYLENFRDFGSKFMEQASRIAAILHVLKNEQYKTYSVDHQTMQVAIQLTEVYLHEAMMIFREPADNEEENSTHANALIEWMIENWRCEWVLKSEIRRSGPHCVRNLSCLENAIQLLIRKGDIYCFRKKQSIYISLSWDKYPRLVRGIASLTRNGYPVRGLRECQGKYGSQVKSNDALRTLFRRIS